MHELSIARGIIDIAGETARKNNIKVISEIEIEVGTISGIVIESLEFALEVSVKNTILENAKTTIIKIPCKAKCLNCSHEFEIDNYYTQCPQCEHFNFDILQGKELKVKSIIVD